MTPTETKLREEIQKLKSERTIILKIGTTEGFYKYYFEKLNEFKTNVYCFNYVNDLYQKYFGEPKYSSYNSFRNQRDKSIKK